MRERLKFASRLLENFRGLNAVFYKEVLHIKRDSLALFFALAMPVMQMIIIGFGVDTNIRQVKTVVLDEDMHRQSRELIDRLRNTDTFRVVSYVSSDAELNDAIVSGRAHVGVKIPVDYSRRLLDNDTAQVLVLIDWSVAAQALNVSAAVGLDQSLQQLLGSKVNLPVEIRPKLLFNPGSRSPNFFLPGLTAVLLLFVTTFLTTFSIVREREQGTLEQLFVTPVRPMGLLLGKLLPYLVIGFVELLMILLSMRVVFRVPIAGSVLLLLLLAIPYLFVALTLGMLISTKAKSQAEAIQMALLTMLPSIFFSGYIFPRETMPTIFYLISCVIPATYFVNIARGVILRGATLAHLWVDAAVLTAMGIGILMLAARRFRNKFIA